MNGFIIILDINIILVTFLIYDYCFVLTSAYTNNLFTIQNLHDKFNEASCGGFNNPPSVIYYKQKLSGVNPGLENVTIDPIALLNMTFKTIGTTLTTEKDPFPSFQKALYRFIHGKKIKGNCFNTEKMNGFIIILDINIILVTFLIYDYCFVLTSAYTNNLFTIQNLHDKFNEASCGGFNNPPSVIYYKQKLSGVNPGLENVTIDPIALLNMTFKTIGTTLTTEKDPFPSFQKALYRFIHGKKIKERFTPKTTKISHSDRLVHYPSGSIMRADLFLNKSAVHMTLAEFIHSGHCRLRVTKDYMQTAVDAFSIILYGTIEDVLRLPANYVLHSGRTISMMKIAQEKLAATWVVVKANRRPVEITHETLELYRPLFKYINGREIARLNLSDERILHYVGTHPELNRHQVGVVASKYIHLNPKWKEPKYLNLMNNLLCGVPMTFMRKLPESTFLQLSHQLFYHIRACDPLQRRFYLAFMTKTQALGKSYSWNARDVSRLGLLLAEVHESELSAIKPEAMAGITAQVMLVIPAHKLSHITDMQLSYIGQKPLNIYARRLKKHKDYQEIFNRAAKSYIIDVFIFLVVIKQSI